MTGRCRIWYHLDMRTSRFADALGMLVLFGAAVVSLPAPAVVSAVSSNAISLDAGDRSMMTVASASALPSFDSTKLPTVIILR